LTLADRWAGVGWGGLLAHRLQQVGQRLSRAMQLIQKV
jgi:hypothetical protein